MLKTVKVQKEEKDYKEERKSKVNILPTKKINEEELKTEKDYIEGQDHLPRWNFLKYHTCSRACR